MDDKHNKVSMRIYNFLKWAAKSVYKALTTVLFAVIILILISMSLFGAGWILGE